MTITRLALPDPRRIPFSSTFPMTTPSLMAVVTLSGRLLCVIIRRPKPRANLTPAYYSFTQKCLDLGAATVILYDFLLTFEKEQKVVWGRAGSKVNFIKVLWVAVGVHSSTSFLSYAQLLASLWQCNQLFSGRTVAKLLQCKLIPKTRVWYWRANLQLQYSCKYLRLYKLSHCGGSPYLAAVLTFKSPSSPQSFHSLQYHVRINRLVRT